MRRLRFHDDAAHLQDKHKRFDDLKIVWHFVDIQGHDSATLVQDGVCALIKAKVVDPAIELGAPIAMRMPVGTRLRVNHIVNPFGTTFVTTNMLIGAVMTDSSRTKDPRHWGRS